MISILNLLSLLISVNKTQSTNNELSCNQNYQIMTSMQQDEFNFTITNDMIALNTLDIYVCPTYSNNSVYNNNSFHIIIKNATQQIISIPLYTNYCGYINLLNVLKTGEYIVTIDNTTEISEYSIEMFCEYYTWPIAEEKELNYNLNPVGNISCDTQLLYNASHIINPYKAVAYYHLNITSETPTPIIISTCHAIQQFINYTDYIPDTWMYLLQNMEKSTDKFHKSASLLKLIDFNDNTENDADNCVGASITKTELLNGEYIIAVGIYGLYYESFEISIQCGDHSYEYYQPAKYEFEIIITIIVSIFLFSTIIFIIFYCKKLKQLKQKYEGAIEDSISYSHEDVSNNIIDQNNKSEYNEIEIIIKSIIESSENETGLDIYQILAFRYRDIKP
eukprot:158835_1